MGPANEGTTIRLWKQWSLPLDRLAMRLGKTLEEAAFLIAEHIDRTDPPPDYRRKEPWRR